jgi:uncharacterized Zn-finger protein
LLQGEPVAFGHSISGFISEKIDETDVHAGADRSYHCNQCFLIFAKAGLLDAHVIRKHKNLEATSYTGSNATDTMSGRPRRQTATYSTNIAAKQSIITSVVGTPKRKPPERQVSVIVIQDDEDSPKGLPKTHTEHVCIDDITKPSRKRQKVESKLPPSPRAKRGDIKDVFRCAYCPEKFDTMDAKQEHLKLDHPDHFDKLKARCWQCPFRFRSIADLTKHVEATHPVLSTPEIPGPKKPKKASCFVCHTEVAQSGLRQHVKTRHPNAWLDDVKLDKMQKRYCPVCERQISTEQRSLRGHVQTEHQQLWKRELTVTAMLTPEGQSSTWATRFVKCPVCGLRYDSERLNKHMELKHGREEGAP